LEFYFINVFFVIQKIAKMNIDKILEIVSYTLPSLITGGVAYFLFTSYFKDQQNTRRWLLVKENQKESLPLRLQAYERMVLFLERIHPAHLLLRVAPPTEDKNDYATLLIHAIQTEFEHNLTQQIYITNECWDVINKSKTTTVQLIRNTSLDMQIATASQLREAVLRTLTEMESPTSVAVSFIKEELKSVL
jgi:hypothetical protein